MKQKTPKTPTPQVLELNRKLVHYYYCEAREQGIRSPYRQQSYVQARLAGASQTVAVKAAQENKPSRLELFNDNDESYTPEGVALENELVRHLQPIIDRLEQQGARLRDIAEVAVGAVNTAWARCVSGN